MFQINFPELRQVFNYDCGASALQGVMVYYGVEMREDILMKEAGTTQKHGTPVAGLVRAAKNMDCRVK